MRRNRTSLGSLAILAFLLCFTAHDPLPALGREAGQAKSLPAGRRPERIVSLVPALTEQLYLLGAGEKIVGVTSYCQRPPQAQAKEKVGTVIDINIERVIELRPDLVIASRLVDDKQVVALRNLRQRVEIFDPPRNFEDLCEGFLALARMVGREREAEEILNRTKKELDATRRSIQGIDRPRVFVQIGADPLFTTNDDYFINDLIEYAGGINIAGDAETGIFSREEVIRRNPDVIVIVTMGIAGEKEEKVWSKYTTINAVRNLAIFPVDSYRVCSPSPVSFVETVKELARIFHEQK